MTAKTTRWPCALRAVWDASIAFAEAFGLRMGAQKCVRWAPTSQDLAALAALLGPPVRAHFKDLGVDRPAGRRREGCLAAERVAGAGERLRWCISLALGVRHKMRIMSDSGLPVALGKARVRPVWWRWPAGARCTP